MTAFAKALADEAARLERLLAQLESQMRAAFRQFVAATTSEEVLRQVADLLERGDVQGAIEIANSHIRVMGAAFPLLYQDVAVAETAQLASQLGAVVGVSFDVGNPAAVALMRANQLEFVQAFTDEQAVATRAALAGALETGEGFAGAARAFRASIGLSQSQVAAVANYRRLLMLNSSQALDRALRDRRYDRGLETAIDTGEPLSQARIDTMVERYRQRQLAFRADTIARTESVKILSEAQQAAMAQTMEQAGIAAEQVSQTWHTTMDGRERFTHGEMNGQQRPFGTPFDSPSGAQLHYPGDPSAPADEVINCRCHRSFSVSPTV